MMSRFLKHQKHHHSHHDSHYHHHKPALRGNSPSSKSIHKSDKSISWLDYEQYRARLMEAENKKRAKQLWWCQVGLLMRQIVVPTVTMGAIAYCINTNSFQITKIPLFQLK